MVAPEARLEMALVGAVTFPIALFWFGWCVASLPLPAQKLSTDVLTICAFCRTSFPSISFWSPMLAGGLLGFSILFLFLALFKCARDSLRSSAQYQFAELVSFCCSYIIDVYLFAAASALAGNTVCRSAFGTGCVAPSPSFLHQSLTTDIGDVLSPSVSPCSLRRCLRCVPARSLVLRLVSERRLTQPRIFTRTSTPESLLPFSERSPSHL